MTGEGRRSPIVRLMHRLGAAMENDRGEKPAAVRMMRLLDIARDAASGGPLRRVLERGAGKPAWPTVPGAYVVGDPAAPVAVCALTSDDLVRPLAALAGVAIAGRLYTPNLGIEKVVLNVTSNPRVRFVLLCDKESPVFHPGQALRALCRDGITPERRIVCAVGHLPVLGNVPPERVEDFRRQVELVNLSGEADLGVLGARILALLERDPGPFPRRGSREEGFAVGELLGVGGEALEGFATIGPGGGREPLSYDPKGFFVVTLEREAGRIVLRHYLPDNTPKHEMRGRSAEAMLLGLLREGLVSQLSHAGYLGAELAKAEAALRLSLDYEQDKPLRGGERAG